MKKGGAVFLLILSVGVFPAAASQGKDEFSTLGYDYGTVADGEGVIRINSFGNTRPEDGSRSGFSIGGIGHVAEFSNYVSINNGRVERTGDSGFGWEVVSRLEIAGGTASSTIQRQNALQIRFTHTVRDNGGGLVDWLVSAEFTNLSDAELDVCYFPYIDYDLFGTELNDTATYSDVDDDFLSPAVRVQKLGRQEVFVFVDRDAYSTEWRIREWSSISSDPLRSGQSCVSLPNMVTPFGPGPGPGDFAGAYKFPLALAPSEAVTIDLQLGRFQ